MDLAAEMLLLPRLFSSSCRVKLLHFLSLINGKQEQEPLPFPQLPMVPVSWPKATGRLSGTSAYCLRRQLEPCMCVRAPMSVCICIPVSTCTEQT